MHLLFITSLLITFTNIIFLLITQATVMYLAFECPHLNLYFTFISQKIFSQFP